MKNIGRILALFLLLTNFYVVEPASASITGASNVKVQSQSESAADLDVLQKRDAMKSLQTQFKSPSDDANKKLFDQKSNSQSLQQVPIQQNVTSGSSIGLSKLQGTVPDVWEEEPNNTDYTADLISLDAKVLGNFSNSTDNDYFEIEIAQAGTLKIMGMAGDESGNYSPYFTLGLYDYYGTTSLDWTNDKMIQGGQTQYMEFPVSRGTYYIKGMTWDPVALTHSSKIVGQTYRFVAYMAITDTTPPTVVAQDYYHATNVPVSANFGITYDEAIKIVDPSKIYFWEWDSLKDLMATTTVNGTKLSITPVNSFLSQTKYMVAIYEGAISDSSGNIPEDYYYSFTTGDDGTINVTSVSLNTKNLSLLTGSSETLEATIYPLDACNQDVVWSSSNESVAKVEYSQSLGEATVRAIGPGRSIITVTTLDGGFTDFCTVDVTNSGDVNVTSVSLNKRSLTLTVGMTEKLQATIAPSNATNQALAWVSNANTVATVDQTGLVKAIGPGQARITLISADGGKTDYCDVEVKKQVSAQPGDANSDGKVTIMDAVKIARSLVGLEPLTDSQKLAADFNGDGRVTIMDAQGIAKYLVNK